MKNRTVNLLATLATGLCLAGMATTPASAATRTESIGCAPAPGTGVRQSTMICRIVVRHCEPAPGTGVRQAPMICRIVRVPVRSVPRRVWS